MIGHSIDDLRSSQNFFVISAHDTNKSGWLLSTWDHQYGFHRLSVSHLTILLGVNVLQPLLSTRVHRFSLRKVWLLYFLTKKRENVVMLVFACHPRTITSRNVHAADSIGTAMFSVCLLFFQCCLSVSIGSIMSGQNLHWKQNHKRICRIHDSFVVSDRYQILPEHERLDSLLLSYTIARLSLLEVPYIPSTNSSAQVLMSLLPHQTDNPSKVPVMSIKPPPPGKLIDRIYPCFGNNNFVIHSHLTGVAHAVFPFTSRLFNHSCVPNAVAKYKFSHGQSVLVEIIALRDIHPEEEVCCVDFQSRKD